MNPESEQLLIRAYKLRVRAKLILTAALCVVGMRLVAAMRVADTIQSLTCGLASDTKYGISETFFRYGSLWTDPECPILFRVPAFFFSDIFIFGLFALFASTFWKAGQAKRQATMTVEQLQSKTQNNAGGTTGTGPFAGIVPKHPIARNILIVVIAYVLLQNLSHCLMITQAEYLLPESGF